MEEKETKKKRLSPHTWILRYKHDVIGEYPDYSSMIKKYRQYQKVLVVDDLPFLTYDVKFLEEQ